MLRLLGYSSGAGRRRRRRRKTDSITAECPPPTERPLQDSPQGFLSCLASSFDRLPFVSLDTFVFCFTWRQTSSCSDGSWLLLLPCLVVAMGGSLQAGFLLYVYNRTRVSRLSGFCGKTATQQFRVRKVLIGFYTFGTIGAKSGQNVSRVVQN